jgi:hypothetical protein
VKVWMTHNPKCETSRNVLALREPRRAQRASRSSGPARVANAASLGERPRQPCSKMVKQ